MSVGEVRLKSGAVLPDVVVAYQTHGRLNAAGTNAILVSHGNTADFHVAGKYAPGATPEGIAPDKAGWWDAMIGPGKAIDTDHYFVVSSNMLGGSWGTTGPRSLNPKTGKPYGPEFPAITLEDMVTVQRALLKKLGVRHLVAAAGGSYGGNLSMQWGISQPGMVDGVVVAANSLSSRKNPAAVQRLADRLARDANWNGGWYYERPGGMFETMLGLRLETLRSYGWDEILKPDFPDPAARTEALKKLAEPWARAFDAHSLLVQRKAFERRDLGANFGRVKAKVLYVLSTSDKLAPTSAAPRVMGELKAAGVDATYHELVSDQGHSAYRLDAAKWAPQLRAFLARLPAPGAQ